jgi:ribosomal protein S18 acetylase RimI-like enzyme
MIVKNSKNYKVRTMVSSDYDEVYKLWYSIKSFAIRQIDDSRDGIVKFLKRNKTTCVVAVCDGKIIGSILCGHDGREACFYHVCVREDMRNHGVATHMVNYIIDKLNKLNINKIRLVAFKENKLGNKFWKDIGFAQNKNINIYEKTLNKSNHIKIIKCK